MGKNFSIRLADEDKDFLEQQAAAYGLTPADLIRIAIKSTVEAIKANDGKLVLPFELVPKHMSKGQEYDPRSMLNDFPGSHRPLAYPKSGKEERGKPAKMAQRSPSLGSTG